MKILAIESATAVCSVALDIDGRVLERVATTPARAEGVLALIVPLFVEGGVRLADLDAIAFGRGPGSFTGLRVAASITQGLAFAAGLAVVAVSSLQVLAQTCGEAYVLAAIDARRDEVYYGYFHKNAEGLAMPLGDEGVCVAERVPIVPVPHCVGVGTGWDHYGFRLSSRLGCAALAGVVPRAAAMIPLARQRIACGATMSAMQALPVYLRDDIVSMS
ncbi:MAG: tRNA (adenosine(37)-N6)-threonylcarbamoyltransferase complex dimerization subunit type 1 TsaB [Acidiferrobacter sp.]